MIRLEEVVAAVLNEMAIARTKATLFAAQMAVDFRDHTLLRHLPVPLYGISGAEVSLPFAIANVSAGHRVLGSLPIDPADLATAAKNVAAALPEEEVLKKGFSLYDHQVGHWRRQVAPAVAERLAADAAGALSIDGLATIYGYLVKTRYLLSLMQRGAKVSKARIHESVEAGFPDLLGDSASQMLKCEVERRLASRVEENREASAEKKQQEERKPLPLSTPMEDDFAVYVNVEAKELKDAEHVSILKLQLQEGTLNRMTYSDSEEVGDG